jgi:serine/threonine protein phosphatase PrpC
MSSLATVAPTSFMRSLQSELNNPQYPPNTNTATSITMATSNSNIPIIQGRTGSLTRRGRRQRRDVHDTNEKAGDIVIVPPVVNTAMNLPRIATASATHAIYENPLLKSISITEQAPPLAMHVSESRDLIQEEHGTASVTSIRGLKPGNPNWINQDNYFVIENFDGRNINLYCVLDGHGEHGHHVSRRCREMLPQFIKTANQDMKRAFFLMQTDLLSTTGFDANCSGATCVLVSLQNRRLTIGNCGDSRAILCTRNMTTGSLMAHPLSIDHKPDRPEERKRIITCGGRLGCRQVLINDRGMAIPTGPCRVWYTYRGDSMGLAMSRSLGDLVVHNVGVSAEPEIIEHTLENHDEFVIIATDGVWDVVDNSQAIQLVSSISCKGPTWNTLEASSLLTKFARSRWTKLSLTADDITCVVVKLR